MKIKIYLLAISGLFIVGLIIAELTFNEWPQNKLITPQNELITGYYDSVNDWFVFEWNNSDYGKLKTIYDPANKIRPIIKINVEFDKNKYEYTYIYEVTNQEGAVQPIYKIFIKHLTSIYDTKAPSPLEDWHMGEYRDKDTWYWAKTGGIINGIPSGQTVSGFSFKSKGIPTILNSVFTGYRRATFSGPGDSDTKEVNEAFDKVFNDLKEKYKEKFEGNVVKRTIGPTTPPVDFKPIEFINYIINLKHDAFSLSWITNEEVEQSFDAKLENAKLKITQKNINDAKNILTDLLNEVEAMGCKNYNNCPKDKYLTPEAYALLFYNVNYLIEQLK